MVEAGGLHIIGTERHEARRIDNQLRGRAGRQGDPGSSRFYVSLEDDLMKRFGRSASPGLMDRLGLEEDVPIEQARVARRSRTPRPVEGFNFDIRKHVVEYDDVMNKQREAIYAERDKVLRNEDLTETVRDFLDDEVDAMADQLPRRRRRPGVEPRGPRRPRCRRWASTGAGTTEEELGEFRTREELAGHLRDLVDGRSRRRTARDGEEVWSQVERFVLLRTIDSLWVEHLTEIDDMRRGIGLRGYAQQDPLNEFRKEAFRLYEELAASSGTRSRPRSSGSPSPASRRPLRRPEAPPADPAQRRCGRGHGPPHGVGNGSGSGRAAAARVGPARPRHRPARHHRARRPTGPPARPVRSPGDRTAREVPGDAPPRTASAGIHPLGCPDRTQRLVLVRVGPEVQEVSRGLSARVAGGIVRSVVVAGLLVAAAGGFAALFGSGSRAPSTRNGPPTRSSSSARPSTTAGPPPCSGAARPRDLALPAGVAPHLVVTGGKRPGDRTTEAAVARRYAIDHGVPAEAIFGEDEARNTLDSLRAVGARCTSEGCGPPCSSPIHAHAAGRPDRLGPGARGVLVAHPDLARPARSGACRQGDDPRAGGARRVPRDGRRLPRRGRRRLTRRPHGRRTVNDPGERAGSAHRTRHEARFRAISRLQSVRPLGLCVGRTYTPSQSSALRDRRPSPSRAESSPTRRRTEPSTRPREGPGERELVKQAEEAQFVDLIACEKDCRNCSYAAALDCDGNCGVCPHNSYCPCVNPVVARSKTALRLIELRPILLQDLQVRG